MDKRNLTPEVRDYLIKKRAELLEKQKKEKNALKKKVHDVPQRGQVFSENGIEYAIDAKTGKKYQVLPEAEFKMNNNNDIIPVLQVDDFNDLDLTGEADRFLAHLRVPPNKAEIERLIEQRKRLAREQNEKYNDYQKDIDDKIQARKDRAKANSLKAKNSRNNSN